MVETSVAQIAEGTDLVSRTTSQMHAIDAAVQRVSTIIGEVANASSEQAEGIRQQTVEQARRMLAAGKSTDEVLDYLANTLTNRLLHAPTQALRQASELADLALAETVTRLLTEERER